MCEDALKLILGCDWVPARNLVQKDVPWFSRSWLDQPRISVVTPDRGDRPEFLNQCKVYVKRQTLQPIAHLIVNNPPLARSCDIGHRLRSGISFLKDECDYVAVMENDDWYSPNYLEVMVKQLKAFASKWGYPLFFGIDLMQIYHLNLRRYATYTRRKFSCLCCMLLRSDILDWVDWGDECYVDGYLFRNKCLTTPNSPVCVVSGLVLGIKHGIGLCGTTDHKAFKGKHDKNLSFLSRLVGGDLEFYKQTIRRLNSPDRKFFL